MTERYEIVPEIVAAIAQAEDTDKTALGYTLYEHVDADAIKSLAASDHTEWTLTFQVPEHTVTVHGDGRILVDDDHVRTVGGMASAPSQSQE